MLVKIYNLISFLGWVIVIFNTNLLLLQSVQALAIFDVIFAYLNLIKTNYIISFIQILSRYFIVFIPLKNNNFFIVKSLSIIWGISDSIRYLYYFNLDIPLLKFLRYNLFWFLYPLGISFEILSCYYSPLKSIIIPIILIYLICGFQLYYHMINQNFNKKN